MHTPCVDLIYIASDDCVLSQDQITMFSTLKEVYSTFVAEYKKTPLKLKVDPHPSILT